MHLINIFIFPFADL